MATPLKRLRFFLSLRSPFWPAVFSALVGPGAGQMLNGDFLKGFSLLGAFVGAGMFFSSALTDRLRMILPGQPEEWTGNKEVLLQAMAKLYAETPGLFITFYLLIFLLWSFAIWDAYVTAKSRLHFHS